MSWISEQARINRNGKKAELDTKIERIEQKAHKTEEDWDLLGKLRNKSAKLQTKENIAAAKASKPISKPKTKNVFKGGNSYRSEINGAKVEEANFLKVDKAPKSASTSKTKPSKPKKK